MESAFKKCLTLLALCLLSACASHKDEEFYCARAGLMKESAHIAFFAPGVTAPTADQVLASSTLTGFHGTCHYDKKKHEEVLELEIPLVARAGPAGAGLKEQELPYFLAVLSPAEEILQKQVFVAKVSFENNPAATLEEDVIRIPLQDIHQSDKYKVLLGFELTPLQAQYNAAVEAAWMDQPQNQQIKNKKATP